VSSGGADAVRRLAEIAGKWIVDTNDAPATKPYKHRSLRSLRHFVFVGTSGSHDYLKDSTGNQRFWSVYTPTTVPADDTNTDDDPPCDGIHDTDTSLLSHCTRCFPYGRDAQRDLDEREDNAVQQDEDQDYQEPP
jgi:predicted P-loop ATPase